MIKLCCSCSSKWVVSKITLNTCLLTHINYRISLNLLCPSGILEYQHWPLGSLNGVREKASSWHFTGQWYLYSLNIFTKHLSGFSRLANCLTTFGFWLHPFKPPWNILSVLRSFTWTLYQLNLAWIMSELTMFITTTKSKILAIHIYHSV